MLHRLLQGLSVCALRSGAACSRTLLLTPILAMAPVARGSSLTVSIVNQQASVTSNFASGTVTNVPLGKGPFYDTSPAGYFVPKGGYFRFGIAAQVVNNPDPEAGGAWDKAAQKLYGTPALPAELGLSTLGLKVNSPDAAGKSFRPINKAGLANTDFSNTGFNWALTWPGDVSGGLVGKYFQIFAGQVPADVHDPSFIPRLGYYSSATGFVDSIAFQRVGEPVLLSLQLDLTATSLWSRPNASVMDNAGNIIVDPVFRARYMTKTESATIGIGGTFITRSVPEPGSLTLVGLSLLGLLTRRRTL